ncbi:hypothetical protein F5887DRAFT_979678 [Amanita rubescens]|nr:hypothetical protein F5887DRAFT_979678 [Amanita rubescens]
MLTGTDSTRPLTQSLTQIPTMILLLVPARARPIRRSSFQGSQVKTWTDSDIRRMAYRPGRFHNGRPAHCPGRNMREGMTQCGP